MGFEENGNRDISPSSHRVGTVGAVNFSGAELGGFATCILESTPRPLVLTSSSTSLIFDKEANKATLERKISFWKQSPSSAGSL